VNRPAVASDAGVAPAGPLADRPSARRRRNARGEGARLSDEIVSAALALIDRTGTDEAVTLRAVARQIGIAAPSIYAHFADRHAILQAVVIRIFGQLVETIETSLSAAGDDPVERLTVGCTAYVEFGLAHPARYDALFSQRRIAVLAGAADSRDRIPVGPDGLPRMQFGAEAFATLLDGLEACVRSGRSASTDVLTDATAVWVALHGAVTLRVAIPGFPWPDTASFVRQLVLPLARVTAPGP
jgi:AcrR family transcriptional regulator